VRRQWCILQLCQLAAGMSLYLADFYLYYSNTLYYC